LNANPNAHNTNRMTTRVHNMSSALLPRHAALRQLQARYQ